MIGIIEEDSEDCGIYITPTMEKVDAYGRPVIAEGGMWTPEQLKAALDTGVLAAVAGTAIARPREITKLFLDVLL